MKGIVHFLTGAAAGTFFPAAVIAASQGSFILVLGGIGGLLPDAIDFKFARFIEQPDIDIDPHPQLFEAQAIADQIAEGIDRVADTKKRQILLLRTMKLGPDWWQQYSVRFDTRAREVIVKLGPIVNTSQLPLPETGSELPVGRAKVHTGLLPTYGEETKIDIFGGPSFLLEWRNGKVEIDFIPWHRQYSHSLVLACGFGLICGFLFGPDAGLIGALGVLAHIFEDQLGFLGSNLFWPLTKTRTNGLKLIHSGDAFPNFLAVWTMLLIILFNLDRFSPNPIINPVTYLGIAWLPVALVFVGYLFRKRRSDLKLNLPLLELQEADIVAETQEIVDA